MNILAIDPGPQNSAVIEWDSQSELNLGSGIWPNGEISDKLWHYNQSLWPDSAVIIEAVGSYGMPVGKEVFETCIWIGRFVESLYRNCGKHVILIYRKDIKMYFCNSMRAKDSNIRQVLIDRFGNPGIKKNPGKLYGIKTDMWSALALAVYWSDNRR
jgi:hypothetical protein